jgi:DNA-binding transcriptional MerR regulator
MPMNTLDLFTDQQLSQPQDTASVNPKKAKRGRKALSDPYDSEILRAISEKKLNKQYYGIGEVAEMFHVNTSLIRYWENEFDILKPKKNRKGDRLFRPEDIRNLQLIYHLLRERKYTIEGARKKLKEEKKVTERNFEMVQSLQKVRQFLVELKEEL